MSTPTPSNPVRSGIPLGGAVAAATELKELTPIRISVCGATSALTMRTAQSAAMALHYNYIPDCFTEELTARGYRSSRDVPDEQLVRFQEGILLRQADLFTRNSTANGVVYHGGPVEVLAFALRNYARLEKCREDLPLLKDAAFRFSKMYDVIVLVPWERLGKGASLAMASPTDGDSFLKHCLLTGVAVEMLTTQTREYPTELVVLDPNAARETWVPQIVAAVDGVRRRRYAVDLGGPKSPARAPSPDLTREGMERDRQEGGSR